jgi:hypothetical protein
MGTETAILAMGPAPAALRFEEAVQAIFAGQVRSGRLDRERTTTASVPNELYDLNSSAHGHRHSDRLSTFAA